MELKRKVDVTLFGEMLNQKNPDLNMIKKNLTVFLYNNTNYVIESYIFGEKRVNIFRYTTVEDGVTLTIPPFVLGDKKNLVDISEEEKFFSFNISKKSFNPDCIKEYGIDN